MTIYQVKLKEKRDRENQLEFAEETGIKKGIEKGIEKGKNAMCNEIINRMKSKGYSYNDIADITGLSIPEVHP
ncbi:hypothetical protein [Sediminibacterium ginsengisoli]|uniref:Uncharacterized protein n=1 Tax=Sediminibacterium ginsengisoli TaxID=413434 RepID=A0A1T4PKV3_9BACT|nr:hypothetical protein [Sediminibacterium ginsengisoli]SJZ91518.1 conserved hypothetical protein (putative transposase or invertase) [Sediminibacterium ginsengisoli]